MTNKQNIADLAIMDANFRALPH